MDEIKKIVELLPSEGINRIAETLCDTFEKIVSPLTATTAGAGVFIQSKFEALNAHQQGLAAKCLYEAKEKVGAKTPNKRTVVKPQVVYEALDNTEQMTDESMRSLWSNLLAREFLEGGVHPEIAKLLAKMTSQDALLLLHIANKEPRNRYILVLKVLSSQFSIPDFERERTFNHIHLKKLELIVRTEQLWHLTTTGHEFMRCVRDFDQ